MSEKHPLQKMADELSDAFEQSIIFGPPKPKPEIVPKKGSGKKPARERTQTIFRIIDRKTGHPEGVYERGNYMEYDFESPSAARRANCHGIHKSKVKYKIAKYRVTYELIEDDI